MRVCPLRAALAVALPLLALHAPAQTVYRCGPDGRVYSHAPCADGKAVTVDDPRSAGQQQQAREVAAQDAEQAKKLADERRRREDAAKGQQAGGFMTAPAPAFAASAPARKAKSEHKVTSKVTSKSKSKGTTKAAPAAPTASR